MVDKKCFITIVITLLLVSSCSNDNGKEEKIYLEVTDITLKDIGKKPSEFEFDIESINDSIQKCIMRTRAIKKNDNVESIKAFIQGKNLNIDVISYPYDFECDNDSCFTVHDVSFNLIGLNKGYYNVYTRVNFSETNIFYYAILSVSNKCILINLK
ncbi:MAG: hypothetical protein FWF52_10320 [Candidatus Azobacteroides sp.]|nr:hypothetical protein [Candidatus Azobacteroides sp.]